MEIIYLTIGILVGSLLIWFVARSKYSSDIAALQEKYAELDKEKSLIQERYNLLKNTFQEVDESKKRSELEAHELERKLIISENELKNLLEKHEFQKEELNRLNDHFTEKFENIANQILDKNSEQFSKINQERLKNILDPLKEKITSFEKKVDETHKSQAIESNLLKKEIKSLSELNQQMTQEAHNLTQALKGDNKVQGNWGEFVLERILENSGLSKGSEYILQGKDLKLKDEYGASLKPDVIILLPDEKHIIIDAKVSIKAYEAYIQEEEKGLKKSLLNQHIISIKNHVKGLSEKYYQAVEKLRSPDFVLLFLPIEASFSATFTDEQNDLFEYAWEKRIVIVSPTTLLASLRTIASIWKNEKQNKNAQKIAEESGKLYDKLFAFISDLEKIGKGIKNSQSAFDDAMNKLSTGKGNVLDRAERLKQLGVNSKKSLKSFTKDQKWLGEENE
ncbi:DNA recombination protein RmuC [Fulvivirgaceae bacterium BMA10]|uniref:DNA recombination protein RmuC n=1 Tax=Splendidivirga corallicola TaxID=3051826 RepID=A0ABT8KNP8_9BACT|nr:DNA recombination protein RmuC [Fulvivirgaceae bacterium BMA10]